MEYIYIKNKFVLDNIPNQLTRLEQNIGLE